MPKIALHPGPKVIVHPLRIAGSCLLNRVIPNGGAALLFWKDLNRGGKAFRGKTFLLRARSDPRY